MLEFCQWFHCFKYHITLKTRFIFIVLCATPSMSGKMSRCYTTYYSDLYNGHIFNQMNLVNFFSHFYGEISESTSDILKGMHLHKKTTKTFFFILINYMYTWLLEGALLYIYMYVIRITIYHCINSSITLSISLNTIF